MNIQGTIQHVKTTLSTMMAGLSLLAMASDASALEGKLRMVDPLDAGKDKTYVEAQAFFTLAGDVEGFTFIDLNQDSMGYFGKTTLTRQVMGSLHARVQGIHGNSLASEGKAGIQADIPALPHALYANIAYSPCTVTPEHVVNRNTIDYFVSASLGKGFSVASFGQWEEGKFTYGEVEVGKAFGPVSVSYNPALLGDGDGIPALEQRVSVSVSY